MNANPGSYIEMNIPWMIAEDGYVTTVKGQFLLADASTSLQYRSLIECETFEVCTNILRTFCSEKLCRL